MPSLAIWIQYAAVVGVPAFCAQKVAMPIWSAVRVSEMDRISASAARNAVEPNAGGGPGRNWLADVRNHGGPPGSGPPATRGGGGVPIQKTPAGGNVPVERRGGAARCRPG